MRVIPIQQLRKRSFLLFIFLFSLTYFIIASGLLDHLRVLLIATLDDLRDDQDSAYIEALRFRAPKSILYPPEEADADNPGPGDAIEPVNGVLGDPHLHIKPAAIRKHKKLLSHCRNTRQGRNLITDERGYTCRRAWLRPSGCCGRPYQPAQVGSSGPRVGNRRVLQNGDNRPLLIDARAIEPGPNGGIENRADATKAGVDMPSAKEVDPANAEPDQVLGDEVPTRQFGASSKPEPPLRRRLPHLSCHSCSLDSGCCSIYEFCVSYCLRPERKPILEALFADVKRPRLRLFLGAKDQFELCVAKCRTSSSSLYQENRYKDPGAKYCYAAEPTFKIQPS